MKAYPKPLGQLEQLIMDVVWHEDCATVRCVYLELKKHRPIAYTTVMTTMDRLSKKGILRRTKIGKAYEYRPQQSEAELGSSTTQALFHMILRRYGDLAIAQFVDSVEKFDAQKLIALKRLVDEHKD